MWWSVGSFDPTKNKHTIIVLFRLRISLLRIRRRKRWSRQKNLYIISIRLQRPRLSFVTHCEGPVRVTLFTTAQNEQLFYGLSTLQALKTIEVEQAVGTVENSVVNAMVR